MILIGQYDSPFVRRVAIAMRLYGIAFEHRPWSTFGDADKIAPYNPLRRVPTLVLDDGEALIESAMILDYLDDLVGPEKAMIARERRGAAAALADLRAGDGPRRQGASACCTSACCARRSSSISGSSAASRRYQACWRCWKRSAPRSRRRTGSARSIGHADIAVACVLRFTGEAHPALFDARYPALKAHSARLRGAAAVPGNRAAAGAAERLSGGVGPRPRSLFVVRALRSHERERAQSSLHGVVSRFFQAG